MKEQLPIFNVFHGMEHPSTFKFNKWAQEAENLPENIVVGEVGFGGDVLIWKDNQVMRMNRDRYIEKELEVEVY